MNSVSLYYIKTEDTMTNSPEIHKLSKIEDIKKFMLAGKATFTLESVRTGRWFTYQIKKKVFKKEVNGEDVENIFYFVSILTGADNESSYTYMGTINTNFYLISTKKSKIGKDTLSYKALNFFTSLLRTGKLHEEINFYHKGKCGKCGRTLTTPESVSTGLGPICFGYNKNKLSISKTRKNKIQKLNKKIMNTKF